MNLLQWNILPTLYKLYWNIYKNWIFLLEHEITRSNSVCARKRARHSPLLLRISKGKSRLKLLFVSTIVSSCCTPRGGSEATSHLSSGISCQGSAPAARSSDSYSCSVGHTESTVDISTANMPGNCSTRYSVSRNIAVQDIQWVGTLRYTIFSEWEHCSTKYSVRRNIAVENMQWVGTLQ